LSLSNRVWYFAYGSNLNPDQMNKRVGEWHLSKRALARNYRLAFNVFSAEWQGNTANLLETGKFADTVYGVVYLLTEEQFLKLQKHERVAPVEIRLELEDGNEISRAKAFLWSSTTKERPPPEPYRRTMEAGLVQHGYKKSLIDKVLGKSEK
jgi:hypothetical protein